MALPSLYARPPADPAEERILRKLAGARHAPASWVQRARIITQSWDGASVTAIAETLDTTTKTVYRWLHRYNTGGIDAVGDRPRSGRPRRLGELERGALIALARSTPPGRLVRQPDGTLDPDQPDPTQAPHWTLDALVEAAAAQGITISRSQVRTILQAEGVRWRPARSWSTSADLDFAPKGRPSSPSTPTRRRE